MDIQMFIFTTAIIMTASFFTTVSGFGFALVATPLLSIFMDTKEAVVFVLFSAFILRMITMAKNRNGFESNTVLIVTLGSIVGIIPGSIALKIMGSSQLEILLGIILLIAVVFMGREFKLRINNKILGRFTAGFLSGFFGSATSVSGPPLVLYFLNENMEKNTMRSNMIWIFGLNSTFMLCGSYFAGNMDFLAADFSILSGSVVALLLGWWLGEKMFYHLNQHLFKRLSLLVVCIGGIFMFFNGLKTMLM